MSDVFQTFKFTADTIDGKIQEFPQTFDLRCVRVKPLGVDIVRQYNKTQCIVAKKVFLIYYEGQVFGSTQFSSVVQFVQYVNNSCRSFCVPAYLTIDNCYLDLNGCHVRLYVPCPVRGLLINGCSFNLWGCQLKLN